MSEIKKIVIGILAISLTSMPMLEVLADEITPYGMGNIVFIDDDFENSITTNWSDDTSRGVKTVESENSTNKYLAFTSNGTSFYNFLAKDVYSTEVLFFQTDIKFTSGNMEIQLRESRDNSSTGFTMAGRIKKTAYYLDYYSAGTTQRLLDSTGNWLKLTDTSKWYTIKMSLDVQKDKYSIYLMERDTKDIIASVDNIPFYNECNYVNYVGFSSVNKLCIDNVYISQSDIVDLKIKGNVYPKISTNAAKQYKYSAVGITDDGFELIVDEMLWSIKTPKDGVSIDENTGVLTVESTAKPGPVIIAVEKPYNPTLRATFLIDLER